MKFIVGEKIGMTQIFDSEGKAIPVTLIYVGPCYVSKIKKSDEKDGYCAVQIAFGASKSKNIKKNILGVLKKLGIKDTLRNLTEFRVPCSDLNDIKEGDKISLSIFKEGDIINVSGVSKGKGFQGGVKRWGFSGRNETHGVKHEHRTIGSVGIQRYGKVLKGKRMPGRTGNKKVTVRNLEVVKVDMDEGLMAVKGAVPGRSKTLLKISSK